MPDMDRFTGAPIDGFDSVRQSLDVLTTTMIGERVLRRDVGFINPGLLGKNIVAPTILQFVAAWMIVVDLWEPRFSVQNAEFPADKNSPDDLRLGNAYLIFNGLWIPRAHLGDFTPEGEQSYSVVLS